MRVECTNGRPDKKSDGALLMSNENVNLSVLP